MSRLLIFFLALSSMTRAGDDCPPDLLAKLVETRVEAAEWKLWPLAKWNSLSGKTLQLEVGGTLVRQSVLAFEDFSAPEKRLIRLILETSQEKKYLRQNRTRIEEQINLIVSTLGLDRNEVMAEVDRLARGEKVEIGAWVVETRSGKKLSAVFTSSRTHELTEEDSQKAFDGLLRKHQIELSDIQDVLMFHNHPVLAPASPADSDAAVALKLQFQRRGLTCGVWYYAISEIDSSPILFHIGF